MASADQIETEYLVLAAQDGDRNAFRLLYRRWSGRLRAHACHLTKEQDAGNEAAQEAWIAIARSIGRLSDPALFPSWAYRITTNKAIDGLRTAGRRRALAERASTDPTNMIEPEAADPRLDDVKAALIALDPDRRRLLTLFYVEEQSVEEIAHLLAIPTGTVKSRLYHARANLKRQLERTET